VGDRFPENPYGRAGQGYGLPTFRFETLPRRPFLREVQTGYLLQSSFLSPRPYCWSRDDGVMISGWEVDRSGGDVAFHPTGRYPGGFAFHNDWFKLVDDSPTAAVTMRRQFPRQTAGSLTLEFRFSLPSGMDGACWQLRDLEQAGVSISTRGSDLQWDGGPVLQPLEANRSYGVKVRADLTTHTADVYVDGRLKARGARFQHPVASFDEFLVQTGGEAVGEMVLNPVNIHKGYLAHESFVTCGTGRAPDDWEVDQGRVRTFECGTKPDIFSLRVQGEARKRFAPQEGRTVFECRFLLPGPSGAARVEMGGMTLDLDGYRTNFWYLAKVVGDPRTQTADVFINGKAVRTGTAFTRPVSLFDSVRFAGNLWVDDLRVYPWRAYPADYVPEPQPVAASHLLGVQSCNLWREGTSYAGWDYVYPFRAQREPYLGWYDEGNPEVADWEIKWQVEHGIGFELHCWYRPNNAVDHPVKDGVLDQGLIRGLFNARYSHLKKFAVMLVNEGACETNPQDWRTHIIPYWIEYFFKDPRYLRIDGKPLVSIYHAGNWLRTFGGADGARQAIEVLREETVRAGFPGVLVLMENRGTDPGSFRPLKGLGVDYSYAYTWGTPDAPTQRRNNTAQGSAAAAAGFRTLPSISMGWDREPWGVRDGGWTPVPDYQALAQWTKDEFMPGLPPDSLGRRVLMLANWNEFGEGHFLMPSTLADFGYLDALRNVFSEAGPHADPKPDARQKARFTTLFPRD